MTVTQKPFGTTQDGRETNLFTITNRSGASVKITDFGGTVVQINVPDRDGKLADVALGFETLADFEQKSPYFGSTIGRYANRIASGRFSLDGADYSLVQNNGPNNLHGGPEGFDKRVWETTIGQNHLTFFRESPDGECGFPGSVQVWVTFTFTDDAALHIDYRATTDAPTIINLTNHSYFNLSGQGPVLDHMVMLAADHITPINQNLIPTGELQPVAGTPFDFRTAKPVGRDIDADDEQLRFGEGYDHNFVLRHGGDLEQRAAFVSDAASGRTLEMFTTEPGVQFYTGNHLESHYGKNGAHWHPRTGFCLEAQKFPDSPNQPGFPSPVLRPGETYFQTTIYRFSVAE